MLALLSMFALDAAISAFAEHVGLGVSLRATLRPSLWVYGVDAALAPIGFAVAWVAVEHPGAVLLELPLMGLLWLFARERSWRIDQALELSSAYRGTALLLGDVVEFDHEYTGSHSRDVVELSVAVGERLRLTAAQLRNLEFAALLHDVGKIAVPKEIINKPGPLDHEEWAIMRRHTIEGQRMLDSVGGVLANVGVHRARVARAVRRHGLSRRPGRGRHPHRGAHLLRLRRVQRHDHRPPVPGCDARGPGARRVAALRGHAVRPRRRGGVRAGY